jgi:sortase A
LLQWLLIAAGLVLIAIWAGFRIHAQLGRNADVKRFENARRHAAEATATPDAADSLSGELPVDTTLWAPGRIEEYEASLGEEIAPPLAVLRIPSLQLEVAVLEGTSELVLNRGLGHITGTPLPGEDGNVGIAGHRDGYFRGLKDVGVGDVIELETLAGRSSYAVTELLIVDPPDVWVLDPTDAPSLTLVTCYPFYFVGSAPKRFIVRAERVDGP